MGKGTRLLLSVLALLIYTGFVVGGTIFLGVTSELVGTRSGRLPPFARSLPRDDATAFEKSLVARFPVGSDEKVLVEYLRREGFHPSWDEPQTALFSKSIFPCIHKWAVRWKSGTGANSGKLVAPIKGQYGTVCL